MRIEEDGCGLVAARGFSRLFSRLLGSSSGPGEKAGGGKKREEVVTVRVGVDVWGRPGVGPMRVAVKGGEGGEEEEVEEILGAEWEAGALGSGPELEAAAALEEVMAGVDREVEEAEEARNALEAAVYGARWVGKWRWRCGDGVGGWIDVLARLLACR